MRHRLALSCLSSPLCVHVGLSWLQTDTFFINSPDIGTMQSLRIQHDNSGLGPAWHLASVDVTNTTTGEAAVFPYHGWLDDKHGTSVLLWPDRDGDGKGDAAAGSNKVCSIKDNKMLAEVIV